MERRFRQVDRLTSRENSYNAYYNSVGCGLVTPNYTEFGWGLMRGPESTWKELYDFLHERLPTLTRQEGSEAAIETDPNHRPLYAPISNLSNMRATKILKELQPILEAWSGIELVPSTAYGLRVYRNTSKLFMHVDRRDTHVISAIFHIDHDKESEPWPLAIESFDGTTVEVSLEPGDMLLYESSKCMHGRPRQFNGRFYTSLFVHYAPKEPNDDTVSERIHYRIPPHWKESVVDPSDSADPVEELIMIDTFAKEPSCEYGWCALEKGTVQLKGPAPGYGKVLTGGHQIQELGLPEFLTRAKEIKNCDCCWGA